MMIYNPKITATVRHSLLYVEVAAFDVTDETNDYMGKATKKTPPLALRIGVHGMNMLAFP